MILNYIVNTTGLAIMYNGIAALVIMVLSSILTSRSFQKNIRMGVKEDCDVDIHELWYTFLEGGVASTWIILGL